MAEQTSGQDGGRQMRFTEEELELVKSAFKGNERLLKLMRKVFLPEPDPNAPLGQMVDLWMTLPVKELSPDEAYARVLARNELIMHVDQQLIQLNVLAEIDGLEEEQKQANAKKDSTK